MNKKVEHCVSSKETPEKSNDQENLPFTDLTRFSLRSGHNHIRHNSEHGVGVEALYQFQPGIMLRVIDMVTLTSKPEETTIPKKHLVFNFKLLGENFMEVEDHGSITMTEGSLWIAYSKDQKRLVEHGEEGQKYLLVMLICEPNVLLQSPFDQGVNELPDCIQAVLSGDEYMAANFTMNADLIQALRIFLNSDTSDVFSRPFLQAKTVELMCLALRNMLDQESQFQRARISEKDKGKMEVASKLLQKHWQNPPTQDELVKKLGVGRTQLVKCFKLVHGYSITDYVLNIRMQHAQQLLTEGRLNVTQVAVEVGYEHSSNFVTIFKRQFGITPKAFQKAMTSR